LSRRLQLSLHPPQPLLVHLSPLHVRCHVRTHSRRSDLGCDRVPPDRAVRNPHRILPPTSGIAERGAFEQLAQLFCAHHCFGLGGWDMSVAVRGGALDDWAGPVRDEGVGDAADGGGDTFTFCIKEYNFAEAGLFKSGGVNE
jgi:hypothetical protein